MGDYLSYKLSRAQFEKISQVVHRLCGINLRHGKEELIKSRLAKRLRALQLDGFEQYLEYIEGDKSGRELSLMIDALTTNETNFFREPRHFDYLYRHVLPKLMRSGRRIRFWSAGCSSGEEPFSMAILLCEAMRDSDLRDTLILATDISTRILERARNAVYSQESLRNVAPRLLQKYFIRVQTRPTHKYRVNDKIRAMVRLARLNLIGPWPMRGPFNVIFCRNVMIYFDKPTRQELVRRFWKLLEPGGYLFVGYSESLSAVSHNFCYVQPAIYVKRI